MPLGRPAAGLLGGRRPARRRGDRGRGRRPGRRSAPRSPPSCPPTSGSSTAAPPAPPRCARRSGRRRARRPRRRRPRARRRPAADPARRGRPGCWPRWPTGPAPSSRCCPSSTRPWSWTTTAWSPTPCRARRCAACRPRRASTAPCSSPPTPVPRRRTRDLTDDAAVVRAAGVPVATVDGDERAAKITVAARPRDRARELAGAPRQERRPESTVSCPAPGRHRHRRPPDRAGRACRLAGLDWPGADGCAGHSDGDVVAHALTDAVLSAAGLGDIGGLLGTDDPRWAGARGVAVLEHVREVLAAAGWRVGNASVQLVATTPKLGPAPGRGRGGAVRRARRPGQRQRRPPPTGSG